MAKDWLDTLNDADVDLLYKYKTQGVDALTDAEVDRAYALQEQKAAWKPDALDRFNANPSVVSRSVDAMGGVLEMPAALAGMVLGSVPAALNAGKTAVSNLFSDKPESVKDAAVEGFESIQGPFKPRTDFGEAAWDGFMGAVSKGFNEVIEAPQTMRHLLQHDIVWREQVAQWQKDHPGQEMSPQELQALKEKVWEQTKAPATGSPAERVEDFMDTVVRPTAETAMIVAPAGGMARGAVKFGKAVKEAGRPMTPQEAARVMQDEATKVETPSKVETPTGPAPEYFPENHNQLFPPDLRGGSSGGILRGQRLTKDENGIPIDMERSQELASTESPNPSGDLFGVENIERTRLENDLGNWKEPPIPDTAGKKQAEIDRAYELRDIATRTEQQQKAVRDNAENAPEDLFSPQSSPITEKMLGGVRNRNPLGAREGGAVDPELFLKLVPNFFRSKLVDPDSGKLQVMYHGTDAVITGKWRLPKDSSQLGVHVGDIEAANIFAGRAGENGGNIHPVYVNIERPLYTQDLGIWHSKNIVLALEGQELTAAQQSVLRQWKTEHPRWDQWGRVDDRQVRTLLQKLGYDGIIYKNTAEGSGTAAIVLDPARQIKSATAQQLGKEAPKVNPVLAKLGVDEEILQRYEDWQAMSHGNRSEYGFEQLLNRLYEKDLIPAKVISALEKVYNEQGPEYLRVRPDVSAERNPLVGPGKKQAGVINLFGGKKPPSFEEFRKTLDKDISLEVARKVYDQYYGGIKNSTPQDKVVSRATGLPEVTSLKPIEEMVPRWQAEADIPGGAVDRLIRENIGSGGRMTAFKTGNSFVDWGVEHVLGTIREGQVKAKLAHSAIKSEVGALTSGFFRRKEAGEKVLAETMGEMLRVNGTKEIPNIPAEGRKLYETLRKELDEVGTAVQEILGGTMRWSPNYLAAMFKGPYRSLVTMLDESGKPQIVGVIAGKTMADARAGVAAMRERFGPDANIPNPKLDTRFSTKNLRSSSDAISELLNHLKEAGPEAAEFQKALSEYYTASLKDYFGYTKHHKTKKGVEGADGNAPWRSQKENVYDLLQSQLDIIDSAHNWIAQQKVRKTMGDLRELNVQKNSMGFLEKYTDHAFGNQTQLMRAVESAMDWTADALGINPTVMKEFSAQIRNTALVGVIGMSGAFLAQSLVQIPMALTGAILKNRQAGIHANPLLSITLGAHDGLAFALKKFDHLSVDGEFFAKYFQKYGTVEPHIVEHEIPAQLIPTSGMTGVQKGATQAANTAFKVWEKPTEMIGKYTIEAPERSTRATFAMTMAHYYRQAGYSLKEAAHLADKDTSIHFVDYSMEERSMAFGKLGEVGKFLGTVSTFKLNSLNQLVSFKNRKMYDVLAATGIAIWATGGLMGLPGFEDIESVAKWMKGKGWLNRTPTEHLLLNGNDLMTYGPLSMSPALAGLPPIALAQKFSLGNITPDSALSFLYPLVSFYARNLEAAGKYAGTPTKENRNDMLRQMAPGNLKYAVDYFLKEKDDGLVVPQAGKHGAAGGYRRSPVENAYGMVAGVPSLQEAKDRQVVALTKLDAKARQELWSKTVDKAVALMVDGQPERSKEQVQKLRELGADNEKIISALNEALKKKLVGTNTTFMEYAAIQARQGKPTVQKMRDKEMWQATRPK